CPRIGNRSRLLGRPLLVQEHLLLGLLKTCGLHGRFQRLVVMCHNPATNVALQSAYKLCRTPSLIGTDMRSELLQLQETRLILHHRHGALGKVQELLLHLVLNMRWEELSSENCQKVPPSDVLTISEDGAQGRGPPFVGLVLQGERSERHLVFLRTP